MSGTPGAARRTGGRRALSTLVLAVIALVVAASAGWLIAAFVLSPRVPPSVGEATEVQEIAVVMQTYSDAQPVSLDVAREPDIELSSPASGRVTETSCEPGRELTSGASMVTLDDAVIVTIVSSVPLWRDLEPGATGPDVTAFKKALERVDLTTSPGDAIEWTDLESTGRLLESAGAKATFERVPQNAFLWVPSGSTEITACPARAGTSVAEGEPLVTIGGETTVSLSDLPPSALPGVRTIELDDVELALSADGTFAEGADASGVTSTAAYLEAAASEEGGTRPVRVSATAVLSEPVQVAALPPSALSVGEDGTACVGGDGETHTVTIAGSELGRTLVVFEQDPPEWVDAVATAACG